MLVKPWDFPIRAEWHRAMELESLSFGREGLTLVLVEEDSETRWRLRFPEVQAFRCVTEESASHLLGLLPAQGAFYELAHSPWLRELGQGKLEYLADARHYVVCCYDEVLEIVASSHAIEATSL
jgi:hypothetical protein